MVLRLFDRELSGVAEDRMLQNVGDPCGILRRGAEVNAEDFVLVIVDKR
jgi:hypothetical protein